MPNPNEFYIGYQTRAPRGIAVFLRRVILGLALLAVGVAAVLATLQRPLGDGVFEYLQIQGFAGTLRAGAYPVLVGQAQGDGEPSPSEPKTFLLVGEGKHGAGREVAGSGERPIQLQGTLIHRDGSAMIEVATGSVTGAESGRSGSTGAAGTSSLEDLGEQTLSGEIVDSKCYLGVMKPGDGKTHRACAALCIRGGIPPLLVVQGQDGRPSHVLLVDRDGGAVNDRVVSRVAEPVEITGRLERRGGLLTLVADPSTYRYTFAAR